jgi:hypothetical protein
MKPLTLSQPSHASRCGASTRAGTPCRRAPIRGRKRCRLHGGFSPSVPRGTENGNYTNGEWTAEAIEERRWLRSLVRAFAKDRSMSNRAEAARHLPGTRRGARTADGQES